MITWEVFVISANFYLQFIRFRFQFEVAVLVHLLCGPLASRRRVMYFGLWPPFVAVLSLTALHLVDCGEIKVVF